MFYFFLLKSNKIKNKVINVEILPPSLSLPLFFSKSMALKGLILDMLALNWSIEICYVWLNTGLSGCIQRCYPLHYWFTNKANKSDFFLSKDLYPMNLAKLAILYMKNDLLNWCFNFFLGLQWSNQTAWIIARYT